MLISVKPCVYSLVPQNIKGQFLEICLHISKINKKFTDPNSQESTFYNFGATPEKVLSWCP